MNREDNPKEWLRYAENDRSSARHLLASEDYEACAFHCQQAVEKLLKAIIVKQTGQRPPHIHDLTTLLRKIGGLRIDEALAQSIRNIDAYYVGTRYPLDVVDPGTFRKPLAESAVQKMDEVFTWFLSRITFDAT
jgi:HEPN domain-containing protein